MPTLTIDIPLEWQPADGPCAGDWMRMLGLHVGHFRRRLCCRLPLEPGQIAFLTGPGAGGKTVLLNALYEQIPPGQRIRPNEIPLESDRAVIDCIGADDSRRAAMLKLLGKIGLGDDRSLLTPPAALSRSRQRLYRLARMLAGPHPWLFVDDLTATLDRISACVLAWHLRQHITTTRKILVSASCHEDILEDLRPDVRVILSGHTVPTIRCTNADDG